MNWWRVFVVVTIGTHADKSLMSIAQAKTDIIVQHTKCIDLDIIIIKK